VPDRLRTQTAQGVAGPDHRRGGDGPGQPGAVDGQRQVSGQQVGAVELGVDGRAGAPGPQPADGRQQAGHRGPPHHPGAGDRRGDHRTAAEDAAGQLLQRGADGRLHRAGAAALADHPFQFVQPPGQVTGVGRQAAGGQRHVSRPPAESGDRVGGRVELPCVGPGGHGRAVGVAGTGGDVQADGVTPGPSPGPDAVRRTPRR
jgi:hypothetical protein